MLFNFSLLFGKNEMTMDLISIGIDVNMGVSNSLHLQAIYCKDHLKNMCFA